MSQLSLLRRSAAPAPAFSGRNTLSQRSIRCRNVAKARALPLPTQQPSSDVPIFEQQTTSTTASFSPAAACIQQALRLSSAQSGSSSSATSFLLLAATIGGLSLLTPDAAQAADTAPYHPAEVAQVADNDEFWSNVVRYIRYFFTVTSGGLYALASPFLNLFKKPTTAVLALVVGAGAVYVLKFTLDAMLGINEPFEYTPGSPVTYAASRAVGNF